uniref:DEAD-box ATP-dependent RNA helicase 7 n=1 Tax=Ciona intestinalis TaxID=7719 RepID=F7BHM4_CIOIN|nr:nucleolar RNA helicase 2 [Ciona intestinalis]|eukprot:XP_002130533.1 nucleolar RNA helicase 2 [Ciona intestinalis]
MVELYDSPVSTEIPDSPTIIKKKVKKDKKLKKEKKAKKEKSEIPQIATSGEAEPPKKKRKTSKKGKSEPDVKAEDGTNVDIDDQSPEALGDFNNFRITEQTKVLLKKKGVAYLFPIQIQSFNHVYDGKDVVAQARTGTGKTLSFAIPLVEKLIMNRCKDYGRPPKVLVMAPTRELAIQVRKDFQDISQGLSSVCIYGGTPYFQQERSMRGGVDIVVGTPGRIMDHVQKGNLQLGSVEHVVLDEVDQMLDMGFAPKVEEILGYAYTEEREGPPQTLLFSATCPPWVRNTSRKYMRPSETVHVDTIGKSLVRTATTVEHLAIRCQYSDRAECIGNVVQMYSGQHGRAMIFTDTKKDANELVVCEALQQQKAQVLHGDIEQRQREITLKAYRDGTVRCLVATNVAARGLDIPEIDLVIQTSPPSDIDSYIHRSGRTGRAGRTGVCVCFYKPREDMMIKKVERVAGIKFKMVGPPQPKDIVKASVNDAIASLDLVDKKITAEFMKHAEQVASNHAGGAMEALASALAYMAGASDLKSRSLLNAQADFTTWHLQTQYEIRFAGFVFSTMEQILGKHIRDKIVGMRLTADKLGAVFDLPNECTEEIDQSWEDSPTLTLKPCDDLPELTERLDSNRSNNRSFGGGRRGGFGRGGGDGGSRSFGRSAGRNGGFKRRYGQR